jgi:ABC-type transporter Mla subunit MlaD
MSRLPLLRLPGSLRRRALLFVLPVLLGIALLIAAIAFRQGFFERYDVVSFSIDSAAGISRGMPVKLKGLMIGQVREMTPVGTDANGNLGIVVTLALNQRYTGIISSDSKVTLSQEGLIGQPFVEILPGSGKRAIANGEAIEYQKKRGLKEIVEAASGEAIPILQDVRGFSRQLADPAGDFQAGLKNVAELTRELPEMGRQTLATVRAMREMVDAVKGKAVTTLDSAEKRMPALLDQTEAILDDVKDTSRQVRQLAQELHGPVLGIVEDGRHVSTEARQIVGAAKQSWPLNAILPPPAHQVVLPDSALGVPILQPGGLP